MELTYAAPKGIRQWAQVYTLYQKAFPASEKKPFAIIRKMHRKGVTDIWRFSRNGKFAGLIITINGQANILLDYLAVAEIRRGTGIGTEILQLMRTHYAGKGVFLEIESVYEDCENREERIRRKHFYEKCGMKSMEVFVWLFGVRMELMGFDCSLTYRQYHDFYRENYGQWAADHIQEAEK
ncbi:MAG: GNAT family N-acetyltransferase [Oscillospiraceae bacterium]|nr:GNAT family N-acetyltransferase [Oscillospiraceae bacterium]